jgi:hypothetical protein
MKSYVLGLDNETRDPPSHKCCVYSLVLDLFPRVFTLRVRNFLSLPHPIFYFPSLISYCVSSSVSTRFQQRVSVVTMETFTVQIGICLHSEAWWTLCSFLALFLNLCANEVPRSSAHSTFLLRRLWSLQLCYFQSRYHIFLCDEVAY